jgi:multimeric flavodoxin WrbA
MARRRADAQPAWKALQVTRVSAARPEVRHHCEYVPLTREQFHARFMERFYDPAFDDVRDELEQVFERAWSGYSESRKSPRKRRAGAGFADPGYELAVEWLAARNAIARAQARHDDPGSPSRILIVNGSTRSEHTCPGEISKTLRLALHAREVVEAQDGVEADLLNVSDLADQPWKVIHPCKACVSTSMALCHWPCSCYPNHALGQTNDWMAEIYPRWVAAHGVIILCPVNWYHAPGSLKLMIDRLVCADGGNPDPTTTHGKDAAMAKALELEGWPYPRHLAGRAFAVVTHGDAAGPEELRRALTDWLSDIGMVQAGKQASLDTYVGYYEPYATSHAALDARPDLFVEVANATTSLLNLVREMRAGTWRAPDAALRSPRQK